MRALMMLRVWKEMLTRVEGDADNVGAMLGCRMRGLMAEGDADNVGVRC